MKIKNILAFAVALVCAIGCENILEENPKSFFEEGNSFKTGDDATSAIHGVYDALHGIYNMTWIHLSDLNGEELEVNPVQAGPRQIDMNEYTSSGSSFDSFYTNSYLLINRANRVIENVPSVSMDAGLQEQILGEARFLRALAYFNLVRVFGDVPLITNVVSSVTNVAVPRDDAEKVYDQVISDLMDAEAVLPPEYTPEEEIGRATSGAAKAILAKVYLARKNWTAAAAKSKELIDSEQYALFAEYKDVFPPENKNGIEHIFSVQYSCTRQQYGSPMAEGFAMFFTYPILQSGGYLYVTPRHIATYIPGDVRKQINIVTEKTNPATGAVIVPGPDQGVATDKYWDPEPCGSGRARNNFMVIRYADVLLMYAEALNELNGPTPEAYDAINQIRARARGGAMDSGPQDLAGLTQDEFRDAVLQERSWELCFEGHRRWDLLRMGKYMETLQNAGIPVEEKNMLYPIPLNEIDVNPELTQNAGY